MGVQPRSRSSSRVSPPVAITTGSVDATDWLRARGISAPLGNWFVEVALATSEEPPSTTWRDIDTRFHVYIYPGEWSFLFSHDGRASWIRMADRAYVHHRDDYQLLSDTPLLREISHLVRRLEARHDIALRRDRAHVRTSLTGVDDLVRDWAARL